MPSVRFSRDKRGYEYIYLVHTPVRRGKPGRTRVLYWYRTPPGVRIGRKPFDEEVQRTLEQQNPGLTFDWEAIIATPMPPPDMTEVWRERRRAEKLARQERRALETQSAGEAGEALESEPAIPPDSESPLQHDVAAADPGPGSESTGTDQSASADGAATGPAGRKRRRRRGGRRRASAVDPSGASAEPAGEASVDGEPSETGDSTSEEMSSDDSDDPAID